MAIQSEVQCASELEEVPDPRLFHRWVRAIEHSNMPRVCIRIVDAKEMTRLNTCYRNKEGVTNVLAFEAYEGGDTSEELGDLVICAPEVAREAHEYGCELEARFAHMTIHGLLHLLGYTHDKPKDAERMEAEECRVMAALGYANPYGVET